MKLCKDCKHFRNSMGTWPFSYREECAYNEEEIDDLVFGGKKTVGLASASIQRKEQESYGAMKCGPRGEWWEPKEI
jgi:hypothetical protein